MLASLLDADRGGYLRVAPDTSDYVSRQLYFPDTAMLITRFMTPDGVDEVTELHAGGWGNSHGPAPAGAAAADRARQHAVRDGDQAAVRLRPRPHKLQLSDDGAVFSAGGMELTLNPVGERTVPLGEQGLGVERQGDDLRLTRTLREGETAGVVLESLKQESSSAGTPMCARHGSGKTDRRDDPGVAG